MPRPYRAQIGEQHTSEFHMYLNSQVITHATLVRLYHLTLELPKLVICTSINISKLYLYYFIDQPSKQDLKNIALTFSFSLIALHALPLKRILCKKYVTQSEPR